MASKNSKRSGSAAFTTMHFFLTISLPKSQHTTRTACGLTKVANPYKSVFHTLKVKPWPDFNKNASKVLAEDNAKSISNDAVDGVELAKKTLRRTPPHGERDLAARFHQAVLDTANVIQEEVEDSGLACRYGSHVRTDANQPGSKARYFTRADGGWDQPPSARVQYLALAPRSSSQNRNVPIVAGELKLPCYSLGSNFTAKELTRRIQHPNNLKDTGLDPFYEALSYAIRTQNGVSLLSNFDQNRYFKVNIRSKEIWMSDLVNVDHRLNERSKIPYTLQALLCTGKVKDSDKKEFSATLVEGLIAKGEQRLDAETRKEYEAENKKRSSSGRTNGAGGSKDHAKASKSKKRSNRLFPPVSRVLQQCKMIGVLGEGVTGEVTECDYNGERVAVKTGSKGFSLELDCMEHMENEIGIYKALKDLQGSVMPRMIEGGLDPVYSASMVLITEKVGMAVEATDRETTVEGKPRDRENLIVFKQEGLRKIRGRGVVHGDDCTRNMRVELRDGEVEQVCWIDFGRAAVVDDGEGRSIERTESEHGGEGKAKSEESEDEENEYLEYPEEAIETYATRSFENLVDEFISRADE